MTRKQRSYISQSTLRSHLARRIGCSRSKALRNYTLHVTLRIRKKTKKTAEAKLGHLPHISSV